MGPKSTSSPMRSHQEQSTSLKEKCQEHIRPEGRAPGRGLWREDHLVAVQTLRTEYSSYPEIRNKVSSYRLQGGSHPEGVDTGS